MNTCLLCISMCIQRYKTLALPASVQLWASSVAVADEPSIAKRRYKYHLARCQRRVEYGWPLDVGASFILRHDQLDIQGRQRVDGM